MCVCVCVCVCGCVCVCECAHVYVRASECVHVCMCVRREYVCVHLLSMFVYAYAINAKKNHTCFICI